MHRVLHIVCFPELYGTQKSILSTVRRLDCSRFEPFVAAPFDKRFELEVRSANARFLPVPMRGLTDAASLMLLRKIIHTRRISLVHCHLGISSFLGLLAARSNSVPAVVSRHFIQDRYTTIQNPARRAAFLQMYRWMNSRFERTICVSAAVRDAIIEREGISADRCEVVHNGVPIPATPPPPEIPDSVKIPPGSPLVVSLSRLVPEKGLETLIRAAALCIVEQNLPLKLVIAGDGPLRPQLLSLAAGLGISDSVFLPGFLQNPAGLLAAADAFILSATEEPFGIALIEAMAAGAPCIASASGGPLEIITHRKTGLLVPPSDHAALASAMREILSDKPFAASLSEAALSDVKRFDERAAAAKIENIYTQIISRGA